MVTTASPTHLPPLGGPVREEVGRELQATLIELLDLSLWGKQLHWSVAGPLFRSVHLELDTLVDSWRELSDTVAERAVAIGHWPDGQAQTIATASEAAPIERGPVKDHDVIRHISHRLAESTELMRTRIERLGELDAVSQDVLIEVVRILEKQLWMARAQLPHGSGE